MEFRFVRTLCALGAVALMGQPVNATMLFGNAEHSDSLPSSNGDHINAMLSQQRSRLVPQEAIAAPESASSPLRAGTAATFQRPAIEWFMVPKWMAGDWHKRGDLTISVTDVMSGRVRPMNIWTDNEMNVHFGHQTDRAGNIWHANFIPTERDGDSDGEVVRFVTVAQKCETNSAEQVVTRTHYVVTKSQGNSSEVLERFQQESLNDYISAGENELHNTSSNKLFKMDGQAYRVGTLQSKLNKVAEFSPVPVERGIDMRKALSDYLHNEHLDNLAPEEVSMAQ